MTISKLSLCLALFLISLLSFAQPRDAEDRIEAYRVQFITRALDLSPAEAQRFWPVYNQYRKEREDLKEASDANQRRLHFRQVDALSEREVEKLLNEEMTFQEKQLELRRKYFQEYKKVLPIKKVARLYQAEIEFQRKLMERLREKRGANR